jgi:DNA recombination protein RmuC
MSESAIFLVALAGAAIAGGWLLLRHMRLVGDAARLQAELNAARQTVNDQQQAFATSQTQLRDSFAALSREALKENTSAFLQTADQTLRAKQDAIDALLTSKQDAIHALLTPMREPLDKVEAQVKAADRDREGSYRDVVARLQSLATSEEQLRKTTEGLSRSLRSPNVRGRWGEMQLRRIVELAGMLEHCDFEEQGAGDDSRLKPDMTVRLPGNSRIVVDAKVPIDAYLRAAEATDEAVRARCLDDHAAQVKAHNRSLGSKRYWDQIPGSSPEFVVMFLPLEPLLSAAFERDGELLDFAIREKVVLATPMSLLALLRAVTYGWQQQSMTENAERIREAGQELCERLGKMLEHFDGVGTHLGRALDAFNSAAASFDSRVMPSIRRFQDLKVPLADQLDAPAPRPTDTKAFAALSLPGLDDE